MNALHTLIGKEAQDEIRARVQQVIPEYVYPNSGVAETVSDVPMLSVSVATGD